MLYESKTKMETNKTCKDGNSLRNKHSPSIKKNSWLSQSTEFCDSHGKIVIGNSLTMEKLKW